jgi:hypothetical protein
MEQIVSTLNDMLIEDHIVDEKAKITLSQKKKPQLYHLGFYYKRSYPNSVDSKIAWRCVLNNCKASGFSFTDKIGETCDFSIVNDAHIEQPDRTKIALLERRRLIKERAANSDDKPRKIIRRHKTTQRSG